MKLTRGLHWEVWIAACCSPLFKYLRRFAGSRHLIFVFFSSSFRRITGNHARIDHDLLFQNLTILSFIMIFPFYSTLRKFFKGINESVSLSALSFHHNYHYQHLRSLPPPSQIFWVIFEFTKSLPEEMKRSCLMTPIWNLQSFLTFISVLSRILFSISEKSHLYYAAYCCLLLSSVSRKVAFPSTGNPSHSL